MLQRLATKISALVVNVLREGTKLFGGTLFPGSQVWFLCKRRTGTHIEAAHACAH
jgi:hypothetical protein